MPQKFNALSQIPLRLLVPSWFEAGSKLVAERFEAELHYAIWLEAGSKLVGDQLRTS